MMDKTGNTDREGDSWSEILNRCGPGIAAKSELAPELDPSGKAAVQTAQKRPLRFARGAALFSFAAIAVTIFPDPIAVPAQPDAGDLIVSSTIREQGSDTRKHISIGSLAGQPNAAIAFVTGLGGSRPDDNGPVTAKLAGVDPAEGIGGPYEPGEPKAVEDGPVRSELQARLPRPDNGKDSGQPAGIADPAVVAALRELRLRQVFDETGMPQLLAQSSSLSAGDAQTLIDRGKTLMSLGDVVIARRFSRK